MNKKKKIQLGVLLGVLVVLLAAYFGLQAWNTSQEEKEAEEEAAAKIYVTDMEDVDLINYDIGDGTVTFEIQDEEWVYVADPDFPLSQSYPEQISSTFSNLEATRQLEDADELADYGLDDPTYTVKLDSADGTEHTIYFGDATGDDYYVTVDDDGEVYTVSSSVLDDLQYTLDEMAELDDYPSIGSGNLVKETITENGETTTYDSENDDDSEDIAAVAGGLGAVSLDTAADYSVEDDDLAGYGLDESSRITVEATYTEDDEEEVLTLYIGGEDGEGYRYVMINDSKIVYLISDEICDNILNVDDEAEE